jgi:predicted AlkP superfamily pyrophosphatase or phosphodiesterase
MARKIPTLAAAGALALAACAPAARNGAPPAEKPSLVVLLVVDQLRADLLDRYDDLFSGGFRRLRDGGFRFTQAAHDHSNTETAPGHATLATGVVPARHGIVANDWYLQRDGRWRLFYSTADSASPIIGATGTAGRSPSTLVRGGLADWVLEADRRGKVASISMKDRAAIPMAGRTKGDVYWILPAARVFVTSKWYRNEYPAWVARFNADSMPRLLGDSVWNHRVPSASIGRAWPDSFHFEADTIRTTFPHRFPETGERQRFGDWVTEFTPFPDAAVLGLARMAIDSLALGADGHTDFLAVSFSQADHLGHRYGPFSLEQLDNLLRLDRLIGELLAHLDRSVGPGRWVLALSADHGIATTPEYRVLTGLPGLRLGAADVARMDSVVMHLSPQSADYQEQAAKALETLPFVGDVVTTPELEGRGAPADSFVPLFRNSWFPGRPHSLLFRLGMDLRWTEGTIQRTEPGGTTHGTPYWYDRHVPLVFYGASIRPGVSAAPARSVDLAPTLAALAGIPVPGDIDGRSLVPLLGASR